MTTKCSIKRDKKYKVLVAKFTNGQVKPERSKELTFKHYKEISKGEDDGRTPVKHMLVADRETSTCNTYTGEISLPSSDSLRYYVGVRNKSSGKMKVYDASIFNMAPKLKDEEVVENPKLLNYKDKMNQLMKTFGSAKRKKDMVMIEKNATQSDVLDSAMQNAVSHASVNKDLTQITATATVDESQSILPPHDLTAENPEDIYSAEKIIGTEEMSMLTTICQKFFDFRPDEFENNEGYGTYIMNRLPIIPLDAERRWVKCKCLMYIHFLTTLYHKKAHDLRIKYFLPKEWPEKVRASIVRNFTLKIDGESSRKSLRCMPIRMRDKVILHILVLCLIVDNFCLEYSDIARDLRIGSSRMPVLFKSIGCTLKSRVINNVTVKTAHLTAPLQLPNQNFIISRRSK